MTTYKLKAECVQDILNFINQLVNHGVRANFGSINTLYNELVFETKITLDQIKALIRKVPEGQLMLQTVQPLEQYTGKPDLAIQ